MKIKLGATGNVDDFHAGVAVPVLAIKRRMGQSNGFGFATFGTARLGQSMNFGGIYQKRVTGYNQTGRIPGRKRKTYYVKMRSYAPTNPNTERQIARRTVFANAWQAWHELTDEEKSVYNKRANKINRVGWRLFISEYLKSH